MELGGKRKYGDGTTMVGSSSAPVRPTPGEGCGFKRWWTPAILEEFEVLREARATMKKSIAVADQKNNELKERVQVMESDSKKKNEKLEERVASIESHDLVERVVQLEGDASKFDDIEERLETLETWTAQIDDLDDRVRALESDSKRKNTKLEKRVQALESDGTLEQKLIEANAEIEMWTNKYKVVEEKYVWYEKEYKKLR